MLKRTEDADQASSLMRIEDLTKPLPGPAKTMSNNVLETSWSMRIYVYIYIYMDIYNDQDLSYILRFGATGPSKPIRNSVEHITVYLGGCWIPKAFAHGS